MQGIAITDRQRMLRGVTITIVEPWLNPGELYCVEHRRVLNANTQSQQIPDNHLTFPQLTLGTSPQRL